MFYYSYSQFLVENKEKLLAIPAPEIAVKYYSSNKLYLFDNYNKHTEYNNDCLTNNVNENNHENDNGIVECNNLYDVFSNIKKDEIQHVITMKECQKFINNESKKLTKNDEIIDINDKNQNKLLKWNEWIESIEKNDNFE